MSAQLLASTTREPAAIRSAVGSNYGTVDIESGVLALNDGYGSSSNAVLNCAIAGTMPGTSYGQLQVGGAAPLNGGLSVNFINGFSPTTNDSFTVLTAGSRSGTFGSFSYPSSQVTMQLTNTPNSVIASVTAVAPSQPLLSVSLVSSNVLLTWTAVSNMTYRVEFNSGFATSNWNALPGDLTSLSNLASKVDLLTPSNRFYRVLVLP